jgi:Amt family ammonium transporter
MADSPTNPAWLDKGDNAWQLTAASLVGLQSIPGLVCIYAGKFVDDSFCAVTDAAKSGLVQTKWAINSAFMCFYAFAAVLVCWVTWGYRMGFSEHMIPGLVGKPGPILSSHTELSAVSDYSTLLLSLLSGN